MQTIVLLAGVPGSGKSTFVKEDMARQNVSTTWISRDNIRKALLAERPGSYFSHEDEVFEEFIHQINKAVEDGIERIYVDATHISRGSRAKTLSRIANPENLDLFVHFRFVDLNLALARNSLRTGFENVPKDAITNMQHKMQTPTKGEFKKFGFNDTTIYIVVEMMIN